MLNNFKKYPSYKDTNHKWIGEIPKHWNLLRTKYILKEINDTTGSDFDELLSVSQYTGVTKKSDKIEEGEYITNAKTLDGYKKVSRGDLVINIMLAWNGSLGISSFNGITSPAYGVYRFNENFDERYFHYLYRCEVYKAEFKRNSTGVIESRLRLYSDAFFKIPSIIPPLEEQTAIANFLDKKTAEIKEFIALKEKTIELLKERKMAIINQAVTKGLDPTVEMKDSGIEWLGEIPKHWEVKKLKYLSYCKNNQRIPIESSMRGQMKNPQYDYYGATGVIDKVDDFIFDEDLILIAEDGANLLMRNIQLVYIAKGKYWVNNHAHIFKPKQNMNIEFLANCMEVFDYSTLISGSAQPKLTKYAILNVPLIQPPFKEQNEIMQYVQKISTEINEVISNAEREIHLIKEYQQSLISEVVTGKVDVSSFTL